MGNYTILGRGGWGVRQARNLTTNAPKILALNSSSEQTFSKNCRWVPLSRCLPCEESSAFKSTLKLWPCLCFSLHCPNKLMTNAVFPTQGVLSIYKEIPVGMLFKRFSRVSASQDAGSHAISRQKYLELPVVQTDGRVDERTYGHVTKSHYQNFSDAWITKFSCLGAPLDTSAFVLSNFSASFGVWTLFLRF